MGEDDFELKDESEYNYKKDEVYSHSTLVMAALKKCLEKRSAEMRDGYWNTKFDRVGNAHKVWVPDSREEFISTVESLEMMQERDYDKDARDKIKTIREKLNEKYELYCNEEKIYWEKLDFRIKQQKNMKGFFYCSGLISDDSPFKFHYIRDKVEACQKIVSAIQQLIKRLGDYQEELHEA